MTRRRLKDQACFLMKAGSRGFSLLELSVSLMIMGLVAGGSIPLYLQYKEQRAHDVMVQRQDFIMMAVAQYTLEKHHLPCPAPDLQGQERLACGTDAQWMGYVPYRTLGIPQDYAMDGYQRPWTYMVWPQITKAPDTLGIDPATQNNAFQEECLNALFNARDHTLNLYDREGQKISGPHDPVALALISHPPLESSEAASQVLEKPYDLQKPGTPSVHVYWVTRRHLMAHYGGYSRPPEQKIMSDSSKTFSKNLEKIEDEPQNNLNNIQDEVF